MYYMYSVGHVNINLSEHYIHSNSTMMAIIKQRDYAHLDMKKFTRTGPLNYNCQMPRAKKFECLLWSCPLCVLLKCLLPMYTYTLVNVFAK